VNQGEKIRRRRQELDLTQAQLGAMVGQTRAHISYIEKTGRVNYHTYQAIAKAMGMSPNYNVGDDDENSASSGVVYQPSETYQRTQEGQLVTENAMLRKENNSLKQIVELQKMVIELLKKELDTLKR
jgi:transcriptional regulator with XRE-family HTH domain